MRTTFFFARLMVVAVLLVVVAAAFLLVDRYVVNSSPQAREERDQSGRIVRRSGSGQRNVRYRYDKGGRLARITYAPVGGITGWEYPGGNTTDFTYDAAGHQIQMADDTGTTRYSWDDLGRPSSATGSIGKTISYEYDPWNRLYALVYPDGTRVEYARDVLGQVLAASGPFGITRYEHAGTSNRIVRRLPNGIETTFQRSAAGRLDSVVHRNRSGELIAGFDYTYDGAGRVTLAIERTSNTTKRTAYSYDALGRLALVTANNGVRTSYTYDALGNRTSESGPGGSIHYDYDAGGRLIRAGNTTFTYDPSGNLVLRAGTGPSVHYTYDPEGRLIEVRNGSKRVHYFYDGEGRRIGREIDGQRTGFVVHRFSPSSQVLADIDEKKGIHHYLFGASRIAQRAPDGRMTYLLEDRLGSTRCVVDGSGRVVARYDYSPFGEPHLSEGREETRFLFAGEEWDADAGLLYLRARYFDPHTGRFLSPDPADGNPTDPQSYNLYAYAQNDPVNRIDPTGLQPRWPPIPPSLIYDPRRFMPPPRFNSTPIWKPYDFVGVDPFFLFIQSPEVVHVARATVFVSSIFSGYGEVAAMGITGYDLYQAWQHRNPHEAIETIAPDLAIFLATRRYPELEGLGKLSSSVSASIELSETDHARQWLGALYTTFPSQRRTRDSLDYISQWDPIVAGPLERSRNIFFPPPGGGSAPLVGGVYLDQTARIFGDLGAVTGATYDPATGRIVLVGDRHTTLPAMRPEIFAAALRAVYSESTQQPGMTIDPNPQNPLAPTMLVIFFGNTENSRLGWVMFESDRVMKGYSIGRDNVTRQSVASRVPLYRSVTAMELADPQSNNDLWSRFWLVPEAVTAHVSKNGNSILLDPIRMRVRTETMRWVDGHLVPAGGLRDPHAETFAAHFSARYADFEKENPVYAELRQVTAAVALAKWMKELKVPIDWKLVRGWEKPFPTPATTPAAIDEEQKTWSEGNETRTLRIVSFGGVDMTPTLQRQHDDAGDAFAGRLDAARLQARQHDQTAFAFSAGGREYAAVALPGSNEREIGDYHLVESDLPEVTGRLPGLPGLTRSYSSLHNERTELGYSWSLAAPHLDFESVGESGHTESMGIEGDPSTEVRLQRFTLSDAFGLVSTRFQEAFIDQSIHRIGFRPETSGTFRALYPEGQLYRVVFKTNMQALFDQGGRLVAVLTPSSKTTYEYDANGRLSALHSSEGESIVEVLYSYDEASRLAGIASGGERVAYDYDSRGNLSRASTAKNTVSYDYDARRLLRRVSLDGRPVVENDYDAAGRLVRQSSDRGGSARSKIETMPDGGRTVTFDDGVLRKELYDSQRRLTRVEDKDGNVAQYTYGPKGTSIDTRTSSEGNSHLDLDTDGRIRSAQDARGVRIDIRRREDGQADDIRVGGRPWSRYQYDQLQRLVKIEYAGGWSEDFAWDNAGQLAAYARHSPHSQTSELQVTRNADDLVSIESATLGRMDFSAANDSVTVTHNGMDPVALPRTPGTTMDLGGQSLRSDTDRHIVTRRDGAGNQTTYQYDSRGLLQSVDDALGGRTLFVYSGGTLSQIRFPNGAIRNYGERRPMR